MTATIQHPIPTVAAVRVLLLAKRSWRRTRLSCARSQARWSRGDRGAVGQSASLVLAADLHWGRDLDNLLDPVVVALGPEHFVAAWGTKAEGSKSAVTVGQPTEIDGDPASPVGGHPGLKSVNVSTRALARNQPPSASRRSTGGTRRQAGVAIDILASDYLAASEVVPALANAVRDAIV